MSIRNRDYHKINGRSRNELIRLTQDELNQMTREILSQRIVDGRNRLQRRKNHIKEMQNEAETKLHRY